MDKRWVYFFADGNVRRGPFTLEQLRGYPLQADSMVWRDGMPAWSTLRDVPELWAIFAERMVEPPLAYASADVPKSVIAPGAPGIPQTPFFAPPPIDATLSYAPADFKPAGGAAITSLITGIAGVVWWCLPGSLIVAAPLSITAIVCGVIGRKKARRQEAGGAGMAVSGIILGSVNLLIGVVIVSIVGVFVAAAINQGSRRNVPNPGPGPTSVPAAPR